MGRTTSPRQNKIRTIVQTVKPDTSKTEAGGSASGTSKAKQKCWTFDLHNITPAGKNIPNGTSVRGVPDNLLVQVLSELGALGYAPKSSSDEMIKSTGTNDSLAGEVLENRNGSVITVQLCLM